jgi:hypothetical protein
VAAAEARLQQLEAAGGSNGSSCSNAEPPDRDQRRPRHAPGSTPLEKDEVLDEIFSFVGRKEWLYVGGVCRRWRGRYLSMCCKSCGGTKEHAFQTSHKSSFVTAARFSLALETGLNMPDESHACKFFDDLPQLSQQPVEVLTLARVHGAAWAEDMCRDAALYDDLELLRWLHKAGCPLNAFWVTLHAIRRTQDRNALLLPWLLSTLSNWSQEDKNKLLFEAGTQNNLSAAKLMLQHGAEWPSSFIGDQVGSEPTVRACWSLRAVAWAIGKGCSWGCGAVKISHQNCMRGTTDGWL